MEEVYNFRNSQCRSNCNIVDIASNQDGNRGHHQRVPSTSHLWIVYPYAWGNLQLINAMPYFYWIKVYRPKTN